MISRRKEIFFVALCVVFSALFTIGCSDRLLHPAQDGARILVQLENSSLRSGDTPPPTEKWQGSAWIENRNGSESHHQKISSETDELSITFENVVVGSEIRIHLDVTSSSETAKGYRGSSSWKKIIDGVNVIVIVLKEVGVQEGDEPGQENPPSQETPTDADVPEIPQMSSVETPDGQERLDATASVADGGDLTYQWYSNTSLSNEGGTEISGATEAVYTATVPAGETRYFYCVVKNTNKAATGNKIATATSNAVAVTNSSTSGTTTPDAGVVSGELGSQTNPVTTWADLAKAVEDTATSTIYVNVHTMTAESSITFDGNKQIIPLQNLTIERGADFRGSFFTIAANGTLTLSATYTTVLDGKNIAADNAMIYSSGTLELSNVELKNGNYSNSSQISSGGLFIYSGTTTLENVIFSGNTSSLDGANDIYLHQNTQNIPTLAIGTSISVAEMYFSAAMSTGYPVIQVNQNSSLKDTNKIKITVGNVNPENIQVVTKDRYTGDLNTLFTVVGTNGTSYALDEEGKVVQYSLGSQSNPVTTWTELEKIIRETALTEIYISAGDSGEAMDATSTITVVRPVKIIAATSTTINRAAAHTGLLFESADALTFTGSANAPIIFDGKSIEANASMISAEADLTMTYCTLQNNVNTSTSGGAIHITEGVLKLNYCVFESNKTMSSTGQGGALCVEGQTTTSHITSCTFRNNTSSFGGGAIVIDGDVSSGTNYTHTLDDCSFTGNSIEEGNGGGIYIASGFVTLNEISMSANTIANNKNQDIFLYYQSSLTFDGTVDISNVYYNFATTTYPKLMVLSNFNQTSSVGITLSPSSGVTYPDSLQLFTLEDGVDAFNWVNNFSIQTEDGTTTYVLSNYGLITKQ